MNQRYPQSRHTPHGGSEKTDIFYLSASLTHTQSHTQTHVTAHTHYGSIVLTYSRGVGEPKERHTSQGEHPNSHVNVSGVLVSGVLHPTHARLSLEQRRPDLNLHREPHLGRPRVPQTHQPLRRRDLDHLEGDASWCERRQQRQAAQ